MIAVDSAPELLEALALPAPDRRASRSAPARSTSASWAATRLRAGVVIAPMQLAHLMGGREGRRRLLAGALEMLPPGGRFHLALLTENAERELGDEGTPAPLPDVRERDGWVHSSLPVAVVFGSEGIEVHRRRELVSPAGELQAAEHVITLDYLSADELEQEAAALGWIVCERIDVALTAEHVGSVIVSLEAPA